MPALEQARHEAAADVAGRAGNEDLHGAWLACGAEGIVNILPFRALKSTSLSSMLFHWRPAWPATSP